MTLELKQGVGKVYICLYMGDVYRLDICGELHGMPDEIRCLIKNFECLGGQTYPLHDSGHLRELKIILWVR